jgi:hypothetical protein
MEERRQDDERAATVDDEDIALAPSALTTDLCPREDSLESGHGRGELPGASVPAQGEADHVPRALLTASITGSQAMRSTGFSVLIGFTA